MEMKDGGVNFVFFYFIVYLAEMASFSADSI